MAKRCWLTWLPGEEGAPEPRAVVQALAKVGLDITGAAYVDDLEKVAWSELGTLLSDPDNPVDLWVIAGRGSDFETASVRFGLSMAAAMAHGRREAPLRTFLLQIDGDPAQLEVPTLLASAARLAGTSSAWAAKVVAAAHKSPPAPPLDFHANVIGHALIGTWIEVGPPSGESWHGALMGVTEEGEILHQAVGRRGELPERTVLNYPTQGIQAEVGGESFTAWSLQNEIGDQESYYVKVSGHPRKIIVGSDAASESPEVTILTLA